MKKKGVIIISVAAIILISVFAYSGIQSKHTFTLFNEDGAYKSEEIQPLFGRVKVSGDSDTDVVFTNVETGEEYIIGYITHGMSETIALEAGEWYTVKGKGHLVLSPVNVRIECR